jgi:hypothetical protein
MAGWAIAQEKPFQISSISFPLIGSNYLDDNLGWTPIPEVIRQLKALGANDVKITVSAGSYDSARENLPNPSVNLNPSDNKIISLIQQLKAAGFQITLVPFVNNQFDPQANLLDSVHSQPADFRVWMEAHAAIMVRWAQFSQQLGVERFSVFADEVQPLTYGTTNQGAWLDMIAQIRRVYTGKLTSVLYADGTVFAGGNNHVDLTPRAVIDALDIIGIGWYPQPITNTPDPPLCQLIAGWRQTTKNVDSVAFMRGVHSKYEKPVFISIAFHSFEGDNIRSNDIYDARIALTANQREQANEYESLFTVLSQINESWFLGVSPDSWNRFPLDYTNTARFLNSAYGENIRGKLAETVLTQWYNGQRNGGDSVSCITMTNGSVQTALTTGAGTNVRGGYASVDINSGVAPYGVAVFSLMQNNTVVSEVGVPAVAPTKSSRIFVDFRSGVNPSASPAGTRSVDINTGLAIVNRGTTAASITFTLRSTNGSVIATGSGSLGAGMHAARFIDQLRDIAPDFNLPSNFASSTSFGTLEIAGTHPLSILALRLTTNQRGEVILTSTPVADLTRPSLSDPVYFSQFADGNGYVTSIVLLNTSSSTQTGRVSFYNDNGEPQVVTQSTGRTDSSFTYSIPANGAFVFSTAGISSVVRTGAIRLMPDAGTLTPVGSGLFQYSRSGVIITETGIPATTPTTHARVFVDKSGGHDTGIALASPGPAGVTIMIGAYQKDGTTAAGNGSAPVTLASGGHRAAFAGELISGLPDGFVGVLDLTSSTPFLALTLRSLTNSRGDFLLTTFPIVDGNTAPPTPIVFPHIVDGGGYQTQIILLSPTGGASIAVGYFGDSGAPLPVGVRE